MKELLAKLAAVDQKLDALLAHDELTAEQRAGHDALVAERSKLVAAIDRQKDKQARDQEREQLAASVQPSRVVSTRATTPDDVTANGPKVPAEAAARKVKLASGQEVEERWLRDPAKGFASHVDFLRAVMDAGTGGRVDRRLSPLAVRRHSDDGDDDRDPRSTQFIMPRAFSPGLSRKLSLYNSLGRQMTAGSDEAGTYSDPYGGFLTGRGQFMPELLRVDPEGDPMGQYTRKIPMEVATVGIPARVDKNHTTSVSGGLRVYRRAETQSVTASRTELEEIELKASALFGIAYATNEILQRSLISFLAILESGFSDEFNAKLIRERLEGTGVGQYEGVLNCAAIVSVAKESGQAADTIEYANVIKMRSRCWGYGQAIWTANHDTLPQLMLLNQTLGTTGIPVWQPSGREDHPDMLLGRPLFFTEFCPTLGDAGDLLLGNWREYLEGQLSPLQSDESMHVRFVEHEQCFKFWMENCGKVWWRSALTPAKSSSTLSPFVKLDAR